MEMIVNALLAVGLHEIAHIAAAKTIGVRIYQVGMTRKGPFIRRESGTTGQNLTITLAGPAVNLLLALILYRISPGFALGNLVLGVSNLLPFRFSDGSRALSLLTTLRQKPAFPPRSAQALAGAKPGVPSAERRAEAA
jgi:stage IV sporulation protein FB